MAIMAPHGALNPGRGPPVPHDPQALFLVELFPGFQGRVGPAARVAWYGAPHQMPGAEKLHLDWSLPSPSLGKFTLRTADNPKPCVGLEELSFLSCSPRVFSSSPHDLNRVCWCFQRQRPIPRKLLSIPLPG